MVKGVERELFADLNEEWQRERRGSVVGSVARLDRALGKLATTRSPKEWAWALRRWERATQELRAEGKDDVIRSVWAKHISRWRDRMKLCESGTCGESVLCTAVIDDDGNAILFDMFVGGEWHGSRRTPRQCEEYIAQLDKD